MTRFEKWNLWLSTALVTLTGLGLLWTKYFLHSADPWAVVNHPLQPWLLKAHIVTAPLLVFAIGLVASRHIWRHLRTGIRHARRSGLIIAAVGIPMVFSGYLIQILTHSGWLRVLALSHIVLGLVFAAFFLLHAVVGGARSARSRSGDAAGSRESGLSKRAGTGAPRASDPEIFAGRGQ